MKYSANLFVVFFVTLILAAACGSEGPKDVVKESFAKIEANDAEGLSKLLHSEVKAMLSDAKLKEAIAKQSSQIEEKGGIDEIVFVEEDIEDNQITYSIEIKYGDGTSETEAAKVVKEDGSWKLGMSK